MPTNTGSTLNIQTDLLVCLPDNLQTTHCLLTTETKQNATHKHVINSKPAGTSKPDKTKRLMCKFNLEKRSVSRLNDRPQPHFIFTKPKQTIIKKNIIVCSFLEQGHSREKYYNIFSLTLLLLIHFGKLKFLEYFKTFKNLKNPNSWKCYILCFSIP